MFTAVIIAVAVIVVAAALFAGLGRGGGGRGLKRRFGPDGSDLGCNATCPEGAGRDQRLLRHDFAASW
ncbi:hypothetical protein [Streptomyces spiramyceticus]|uniref:hypothetical protein n=1 Tax=Streptomyces spiramyceticus TaxID=299717 RepID=UPI00237C2627|nr:hypothetical protein [Streptomyces spiramyceticus]